MRANRNAKTSTTPSRIFIWAALLSAAIFTLFFVARARTAPVSAPVSAPAAREATGSRLSSQIAVEGWVTQADGGHPVEGAVVSIASLTAETDSRGYFSFATADLANIVVPTADAPLLLSVTASAPGYADWTLEGARYYSVDTLRVYPRLASAAQGATQVVASRGRLTPGSLEARPLDLPLVLADEQSAAASVGALGVAVALSPPASIRVYRTATGEVELVPFKEYVKHVLPNEWVPTWAPHALRAGAMAVKEYAWFWIARGGKQVALGADVKDNTDDQVYDPNVSYASTDAAVDATWQYAMTRNGLLFQAQYCAGSYGPDPAGDCPWPGVSYMTQWGSAYYADHARSWAWILQFYYSGIEISPVPPGGDGPPPASPTPPPAQFAVGHGADRPQVFVDAYERNGGHAALGRPAGAVGWWMPYVTENNVIAQPFSGPDGLGGIWIVYDVLTSEAAGTQRAFVLRGAIAQAYASHEPPGPEWVGAPASDVYVSAPISGGLTSQGFERGTLIQNGPEITLQPFPAQFAGWKAAYYPGKPPAFLNTTPQYDLPGAPALVTEVQSPDIDWPEGGGVPQTLGCGAADWSVQFTREFQPETGTYDFALSSSGGMRLWIDHLLAVNAWDQSGGGIYNYQFDFDGARHSIRIQFNSPGQAAQLSLAMSRAQAGSSPAAPAADVGKVPNDTAALRVSVRWLGRGPAGTPNWEQPITLRLSRPSDSVVVATYDGRTDRNGVAIFSGLPAGTYNVHVKGAHSLQTARAAVALLADRTTEADMKAQVEGDVDGDNCVTVYDFEIVHAMVGAHLGLPGFDARADLNGDGVVSAADVSLLRSGFDQCGDISADTQLSALSAGLAPPLSQALSPWLNPEAQRRDLTMSLAASSVAVKAGEIVEVQVMANTGGQPIDGAAFVLSYDPSFLAPVDGQGNPAAGVEPGVGLPSVYTNWIDTSGSVGFAAGMLQGEPPQGTFVLATLRFRALQTGPSPVNFSMGPSAYVQLTYGGTNLLASASGLALNVLP